MASGFFALVLVLAATLLFAFAFRLFGHIARKPPTERRREGKAGDPGVCPVCGVALGEGQKIRSTLFPGEGDRICHIHGCPSCLSPDAPAAERRACPVCKRRLKADECLIARVFERGARRRHVHILGCAYCRPGRQGARA